MYSFNVSKTLLIQGFVAECNLSVTLKNHSFLELCLYEICSLFGCEDMTLKFVQEF